MLLHWGEVIRRCRLSNVNAIGRTGEMKTFDFQKVLPRLMVMQTGQHSSETCAFIVGLVPIQLPCIGK